MLLKIVIPTYNRSDKVVDLLKEIGVMSNGSNLRIIIVDDYSDNFHREKLRLASKNYKDIDFLFLPINTGGATARNVGNLFMKSSWTWFFDDDDFIDKYIVGKVLNFLDAFSEKRLIFLSAVFCNEKNNRSYVTPEGVGLFKRFSRYGNQINTSCVIFEGELLDELGGWDSNLIAGQDTDLILRASEKTDAYVISDLFVSVVQHAGERITSNPKKQIKGKIQFLRKHYLRLHPLRSFRYLISIVLFYPYLRKIFVK